MTHLPSLLIQSLRGLPGFNEDEFIKVHEVAEVITSIRINPAKQLAVSNQPLAISNQPFVTGNEPFVIGNGSFGTGNGSFGTANEPFGTGNGPFGTANEPFGAANTPFGTSNTPFVTANTPFGTANKPLGTGNEPLGTGNHSGEPQIINHTSEIVPWCSTGFYLPNRPAFTSDPLFHAGAYYVQEASSMFLEQALQQVIDISQPLKVLDLCAAPGGKSTHLQSLLSKDSLLVSNEAIKARASILTENITKWGAANVIVTNNDPSHFQRLPDFFDVVVIDAPCSGSGLFRKDADAIDEWSENNVQLCSQRQQRILADALPCLLPGGILIYSTCSYSAAEDEDILQWMTKHLNMESIRLSVKPEWNIIETKTGNAYGYRFYPDKIKGEGFFITVLRKQGHTQPPDAHLPKSKLSPVEKKAASLLQNRLQEEMIFIAEKEDWLAMPATIAMHLPLLKKHLYLRKAGINMGRLIREELVPHHELALSSAISQQVASIELDEQQALQYLRRQDIAINPLQNGWLLVTHKSFGLGWIKAIGSRINNYYPLEWRIRK